MVHCEQDSAKLCLECDQLVHTANAIAAKHERETLKDIDVTLP